MDTTKEIKIKMQEAIERFKKELSQLRTGRAHPSMLDSVSVEVYGSMVRLKQIANVTLPEPRQLLVSPFDPQMSGPIAKAIEKTLSIHPILEGTFVRINIPPLDEAMRKEIVKQGKKKTEEAKIVVREIRRKSNELARQLKTNNKITEDEVKEIEKNVQKQTDDTCKEIDVLFAAKEKEIMTI